jgi:hypothetical protein
MQRGNDRAGRRVVMAERRGRQSFGMPSDHNREHSAVRATLNLFLVIGFARSANSELHPCRLTHPIDKAKCLPEIWN